MKGYQRALDPEKLTAMDFDRHLGRMLGVWSGRIIEEREANRHNTQLVETLKGIHDGEVKAEGLPQAVAPPPVEVSLHRRGRREIPWQLHPLAADGRHVEDRIDDISETGRPRASHPPRRRHERRDQRPLAVGQIACVPGRGAPILAPGGLGPGHSRLRSVWQPDGITKPLKPLNSFRLGLSGSITFPGAGHLWRLFRCAVESRDCCTLGLMLFPRQNPRDNAGRTPCQHPPTHAPI